MDLKKISSVNQYTDESGINLQVVLENANQDILKNCVPALSKEIKSMVELEHLPLAMPTSDKEGRYLIRFSLKSELNKDQLNQLQGIVLRVVEGNKDFVNKYSKKKKIEFKLLPPADTAKDLIDRGDGKKGRDPGK